MVASKIRQVAFRINSLFGSVQFLFSDEDRTLCFIMDCTPMRQTFEMRQKLWEGFSIDFDSDADIQVWDCTTNAICDVG